MNNPFETIDSRLSNIENLLLDLKHTSNSATTSQTQTEDFLTVNDAAKFLKLSVPTIYTLTSKGILPYLKPTKHCYFLKDDLINYLKQGKKKTAFELQNEVDSYLGKKKTRSSVHKTK